MRLAVAVVLGIGTGACALDLTGLEAAPDGSGRPTTDGGGLDGDVPLDGGVRFDTGPNPMDGSVPPPEDAGPPPPFDAGDDAGSLPTDWWNTSWRCRRRVTIDNRAQSERFSDFPVYVRLTPSRVDYARTGSAGEQLRFVDADRTTVLAHEIERWASGSDSTLWVSIPDVRASSNDHFWIYYCNAGAADAERPADVWDSDFRAVWHLTSAFADSTRNANDGSSASASDRGGAVGRSRSFGSGDHSTVGDDGSLDVTGAVTLEAWIRRSSSSDYMGILSKRESCEGEGNYALGLTTGNPGRVQFEHHDGGWRVFSGGSLGVDRWHWLVATFDTASDRLRLYVDGVVATSQTDTTNLRTDANAIELGANGGCGGDYMRGRLDEIRISGTARSAAWIAAQHLSMTDAYLTYGPEEPL